MPTPHPFELQGQSHSGWTRKHFEHIGRPWALLTIEQPDDVRSQVWPLDGDKRQPWPSWHIMSVDVILSVDAAVAVITTVYRAHTEGLLQGSKDAKAEIRRVLGC